MTDAKTIIYMTTVFELVFPFPFVKVLGRKLKVIRIGRTYDEQQRWRDSLEIIDLNDQHVAHLLRPYQAWVLAEVAAVRQDPSLATIAWKGHFIDEAYKTCPCREVDALFAKVMETIDAYDAARKEAWGI
jgi:hypothetical protein